MKYEPRFAAVDFQQLPWAVPPSPDGQPKGLKYRTGFNGGGGLPQVHMTTYEPHWTEARHRHPEDEVLALAQGELTIEGVTYQAPAAIFVGRGTLYGPLKAGAEGATFFRIAYTEELMKRDAKAEAHA